MVKTKLLFVGLVTLVLLGCTHSSNAPLTNSEQVQQQFHKVTNFIIKENGALPTQANQSVYWQETEVYIVYTIGSYSLVQYPKNWTTKSFDLALISGTIDDASVYYQSLSSGYNFDSSAFSSIRLESTTNEPAFWGIKLGASRAQVEEELKSLVMNSDVNPKGEKQRLIGDFGALPNIVIAKLGNRVPTYMNYYFENDRLLAIYAFRPGEGTIGSYNLKHKEANVIAEGCFIY